MNQYNILNPDGSVLGTLSIPGTIVPVAPPPPVHNVLFGAAPVQVVAGGTTTLSWKGTEGASGIYLDAKDAAHGLSGPSGTKVVTLTQTHTFTLIVTYPGEPDVSHSITVTVTPLVPPPPPVVSKMQVGVVVINNRDPALAAAAAGCRYFNIVTNYGLGSQIMDLYPDATVVVRPYINVRGSLPSVDYVMGQLGGARDPRLIYSGINEADQVGQDERGIQLRGQFDVAMAQAVRAASGARYTAGSFSVGCPDWTKQSICDAFRAAYADAFNSGLFGLDWHLYSPNMQHVYRTDGDDYWFETRWQQAYQKAGLISGRSFMTCTETGVDEGGIGGFPAHQARDVDVVSWARRFLQVQAAVKFIQPIGFAIFQCGQGVGWDGYSIQYALPALQLAKWGQS